MFHKNHKFNLLLLFYYTAVNKHTNRLFLLSKSFFISPPLPITSSILLPLFIFYIFYFILSLIICKFARSFPLLPSPRTFLHEGVWKASGGPAPASRQHQRAEEELHGGRSRVQAERMGQAPVHALSLPHRGHQRPASAQRRRGRSITKTLQHFKIRRETL